MTLIKGSASFVEFSVEDAIATDAFSFIFNQVKAFSFKDIDDTYDEYSIGWVSILNMFDTSFAYSSHTFGNYIALSLRVDERKVPGAILKKYVAMAIAREKEEKQIPRLGRATTTAIKERVRTELIRKAKPTPTVADVLWDVPGRRVLLFSTNKSMQANLEDWFKESFDLHIIPVSPENVALAAIIKLSDPSHISQGPVIGREFLTWLWFRSELLGGGQIMLGEDAIGIEIGDKIQLESINPGEKVVCSNSDDEARKALLMGKLVEQMDLIIDRDDMTMPLTFAASTFYYKGVKLPKTGGTESGEEEGMVLERISLFLKALDTMRQLFDMFVALRISSDWSTGEGLLLDQWRLDEKINEID